MNTSDFINDSIDRIKAAVVMGEREKLEIILNFLVRTDQLANSDKDLILKAMGGAK